MKQSCHLMITNDDGLGGGIQMQRHVDKYLSFFFVIRVFHSSIKKDH